MLIKSIKSGIIFGLVFGILFLTIEDIVGLVVLKSGFTLPQLIYSVSLYSLLFIIAGLGAGIVQFILSKFKIPDNLSVNTRILYVLTVFSIFLFAYKNIPYKIFPTIGKMQVIVAAIWLIIIAFLFIVLLKIIKKISREDSVLIGINSFSVCISILIFSIINLKIDSSPEAVLNLSGVSPWWRLSVLILSVSLFYFLRFALAKFFNSEFSVKKNLIPGSALLAAFIVFTVAILPGDNKRNIPNDKMWSTDSSPNIIFILNDALRADHLSLYGYGRETSKNIDKAAARGVVFKNALSASSWTKPSVGSLFTGNYPGIHGVDSWTDILPEGLTTFAEVLNLGGYYTAGFSANPFITVEYNYAQGFDDFHYSPGNGYKQLFFPNDIISTRIPLAHEIAFNMNLMDGDCAYGNAQTMNKKIIPWLKENHDTNFFLYLHYMDSHVPYLPTNKNYSKNKPLSRSDLRTIGMVHNPEDTVAIDEKLIDKVVSRYDDEIIDFDEKIGEVFETLTKLNLWDKTIVIIASDHGDEFGDHGFGGHGHSMFQELIHVPLIFIFPSDEYKGTVIDRRVELIDFFPTICEIAGTEPESRYDGYSLMTLIQGNPEIYGERKGEYFGEYNPVEEQWPINTTYAVMDSGFKYLHSTFKKVTRPDRYELYDLNTDPKEKINIIDGNGEISGKLALDLKSYRELCDSLRYEIDDLDLNNLNEQQLDRLKALGYIK